MTRVIKMTACVFAIALATAAPKAEAKDKMFHINANTAYSFLADLIGVSIIPIGAEIKFASKFTGGLEVTPTTLTSGFQSASGLGFGGNLYWYLGGKALESSWYINPFFRIISLSNGPLESSLTMVGANIGHWWHTNFGLSIGIGLGWQNLTVDFSALGFAGSSISGSGPSLDAKIGFAF